MTVLEATLHGGPAGGQKLALGGLEPGHWPEYTCVNLRSPRALPAHYRHIAAGVYEYQGACDEFDHAPGYHVPRCPDCGSQIFRGREHGPDTAGHSG